MAAEDSKKQYKSESNWQWENAAAGAVAGFATVAATHPLDVVRTRFQVNDGRLSVLPTYRNTGHAIVTIARLEGLKGLYAGMSPAVLGSTVAWGLYFLFYSRAKERYSKNKNQSLSPLYHLASAAEAGGLVCLCTNPIWLVKTRLQLQTNRHQSRPYSGLYAMSDAFKTIMREEGWRALYKGLGPGLFLQVSHGAIQFTAYEELRKLILHHRSKGRTAHHDSADINLLNSADYALLGASSKLSAILLTHPFQVVRARLQQRPGVDGTQRYINSFHVVKETFRFEGFHGFYKGITPTILKSLPTSAITFLVYENVLKFLKLASTD
ncbi:Folate transporter 1, chloroplastic [Linum perenne]